jgi:putative hydrolase of the HAD superfamily
MVELIAFDADDTLWHDMPLFQSLVERFKSLLGEYQSEELIEKALLETEAKNLKHFGYGVKGFTLSLIETALDLSEERIPPPVIREILQLGKGMMGSPVELLPGVKETVGTLAKKHKLILVTKGDLFHQESKLARSGMGDNFSELEIVASKDKQTYEAILRKYKVRAEHFMMVGNSIRSDILPVLALGAYAVHIPYHTEWAHETVQEKQKQKLKRENRYIQIENIGMLPQVANKIGEID